MEFSLVIVLLCALGATDSYEFGKADHQLYFDHELEIVKDDGTLMIVATLVERNKLLTIPFDDPVPFYPMDVTLRFKDKSVMPNKIIATRHTQEHIIEITLETDIPEEKCQTATFTRVPLHDIGTWKGHYFESEMGRDEFNLHLTDDDQSIFYIRRELNQVLPVAGKSIKVAGNVAGFFLGAEHDRLNFVYINDEIAARSRA